MAATTKAEKIEVNESLLPEEKLSYNKCFWIFLLGCILGVIIEGVFKFFGTLHWETHVVSMWGWLNPLYGAAAVGFYIGSVKMHDRPLWVKVLVMTIIATALELFAGLLLKHAIGMRAWTYDDLFLNYQGIICPLFSMIWGFLALIVCLSMRKIDKFIDHFDKEYLKVASIVLSVLLVINFALTTMAIARWSSRHYGTDQQTKIGGFLDNIATDDWMAHRFIEWEFLDEIFK